ncbi:MAG: hypothetical protein J6J67_05450 [Treponema sp.]|nr:hypothetical protein [Treponema sp.]
MKKTAILLLALMAFSCKMDFQPPKKVGIKTEATYNFTVANIQKNFSEYISAESLQNMMNPSVSSNVGVMQNIYKEDLGITEGLKFKLYDYNPNNKTESTISQKYIAEMKLQEIPIDVGSYFENMDFASQLKEMSFDQSIVVPNFPTYDETLPIPFPNINDKIKDSAQIKNVELPIPEGINGAILDTIDVSISITSPVFNTIEFTEGNLILEVVAQSAPSPDFSATIKVTLTDESGNYISESDYTTITHIGTVVIPMKGKSVVPKMKLNVTGSSSGGAFGKVVIYNVVTGLDETTEVKKATGLTLDLDESGQVEIDQTVTIGTDAAFEKCTIEEGYLQILSKLPDNWTGINFNANINLSGAMNANNSDFNTENEVLPYLLNRNLNLKDKVYDCGGSTEGKIYLTGNVSVSLENATIYLDSDFSEIEFKTVCDIQKARDITIDLEKNSSFLENKELLSYTKKEAFPESVKSYVKAMTLLESGLKITYSNTLPEGNSIDVKVSSDVLGIEDTKTLESNKTDEQIEFSNENVHIVDLDSTEYLDFSVNLGLPGTTPEKPYYVVLKNIRFGDEYTIKIAATPVFDWKDVTIKTGAISTEGTTDTNMNLKSMFSGLTKELGNEDIINKINIKNLPLYLFCSKPDLDAIKDMNFVGDVDISAGSQSIEILNSDTPIEFSNVPKIETTEDGTIITDLSKISKIEPIDISELLNLKDSDSTLKVNYSISLAGAEDGTIIITKDDFEKLGSETPTSIEVTARLVIPLELEITEDININLLNLINASEEDENSEDENTNNDIFNRSEPTDLGDVEKYMDVLKSCEISYKSKNNIIKYEDRTKKAEITFDSKIDTVGTYSLSLESSKVKIYTDAVKEIFQTYPFNPDVYVQFQQGNLYIPRNANIEMVLSLGVETDGTVILYPFDDESSNKENDANNSEE